MYFQGDTIHLNSHKLSVNPQSGSQGSVSRPMRLKEEKSCFRFSKCWDYCENLPRFAFLYFTWIPVGKSLALLFFRPGSMLVCLTTKTFSFIKLRLVGFIGLSSSFLTCVCTCHTHSKWWIEVCVRGLLCCGPMTHLCHILLLLIDVDDTIFYTLSLTINGNYAMLFNCHR